MTSTKILLVGLGNYTLPNTRHNVGMMALDAIAKSLNLSWTQNRSWKSDITETTVRTEDLKEYQVTFLKPRKLMNISGSCVAQAVRDLSIRPSNIYVFHDDMQRDIGKVNIKETGSANGHNGIKSVIDSLRTKDFKRVRIGIGRPPANIDDRSNEIVAKFVLSKFNENELHQLNQLVYPMWTKGGLELLCDKGELIKDPPPKKKNKKQKLVVVQEDNTVSVKT